MTVPPGTPQGNYPLTIDAFGANGNQGTGTSLYIYPYLQVGSGGSTFSISTSPPQTTAPGGTAQYTVTVSGSAGLGNVTLTASGGPSGSTVLLNGASSASVAIGGTATMTVATTSNAGLGSYPVSITGMLGTVPKYATALTNIAQAAPASIISPTPGQISSGQNTFTWNSGNGATQYQLTVGSSVGGANYYSANLGSAQSASVNIPSTASAAYVTLTSLTPVGWLAQSYVYGVPAALGSVMQLGAISLQPSAPPVTISSPVPSDTITGCSVPSAGVTAVIAGAAGSQTVTFTASATAQLGTTNIACSTAAQNTLALTAHIETYADGITGVQTASNGAGSYTVWISGFGLSDDGDVDLVNSYGQVTYGSSWFNNDVEIDMSIPDGVCSTTSFQLVPDGSDDPDDFAPAPLAFWLELCPDVTQDFVVQMKLTQVGPTVISTDGLYSENTTVQVTAVRSDTGATIPTFAGTVDIQEDTTIPAYVQVYSQNGGTLPPSVNITAGGTATFVAKSLAGPFAAGTGPKPDSAQITTACYPLTPPCYPLYQGTDLPVPQWIISGDRIDPVSTGPVYDWFQSRTADIFTNYGSSDPAVAAVLDTVTSYSVGPLTNSAGVPIGGEVLPATPTVIALNPFLRLVRIDSGPTFQQTCGSFVAKVLTTNLIHEARHTYQNTQAAIPGNDKDGDGLVEGVSIAPSTIFLDTTDPRPVCNEFATSGQILADSYKGDTIPDDPVQANYAVEMDAWVFSTGHIAGDTTPPGLIVSSAHGSFADGQAGATLTLTVSNPAGWGSTSGTVTVTDTLPGGLTLAAAGMAGPGWTCNGNSCTRADVLAGGASYPPIMVTVNVAASAPNQLNVVSVSGGGSIYLSISDLITVTGQ